MKMSRELNLFFNKILNDYLPPVIRDRRWFGWLTAWILFKDNASIYVQFHDRIHAMSDEEIMATYAKIRAGRVEWDTFVNRACQKKILEHVVGEEILEAGCGYGLLADLLSAKGRVTACDVSIPESTRTRYPHITFTDALIEKLPFPDKAFDTVVTAHTLEHVRDIQKAIAEVRRVCRRRLIVVMPCERPHRYTLNLHLHFFPYAYSFLLTLKPQGRYHLEKAGGEWFYWEDVA